MFSKRCICWWKGILNLHFHISSSLSLSLSLSLYDKFYSFIERWHQCWNEVCHPMNNCHHSRILVVTRAISFQIGPIRNAECFLNVINSNASPNELVLCSRAHSNCLAQRLVFETFLGRIMHVCRGIISRGAAGAGGEWRSYPGPAEWKRR
jgi:hypothetical protein